MIMRDEAAALEKQIAETANEWFRAETQKKLEACRFTARLLELYESFGSEPLYPPVSSPGVAPLPCEVCSGTDAHDMDCEKFLRTYYGDGDSIAAA